ncbi:MAG: aminoglycoside phosphotransferase family protein [Planctomycetota bacterium]|nr:aminoglycoside phosphotransferase family protein [Planctomycetota bacterium]
MQDAEPWQSIVSIALLHPSRSAVLIQQAAEDYALPSVVRSSKNWLKIEGDLVREISESLETKIAPLYLLDYHCDPEKRLETLLVVCEALEPLSAELEAKCAWWDSDSLELTYLTNESYREPLQRALQDLEAGRKPKNRPDWGQRAWRREADAWIQSCFEDRTNRIQSIETLSVWNVSCLLKIFDGERDYYFKASPDFPCFIEEGQVMKGLSQLAPHIVPEPLFVHQSMNWMILEDLGEPLQSTDPGAVAAIIETMGALQVNALEQRTTLRALNLPITTLRDLLIEVKEVFACQEAKAGLSKIEHETLCEAWPAIEGMVRKLDGYCLPLTINHGDLHGGNVIERNGDLVIFDWTWASVSHPFFDLVLLYLRNRESWAQLAPAYFQQWSDYEPVEQCIEAWKLAYPLGLLRMASRYRGFVASLETPTLNGFPKPVAHFLRHFLAALEPEKP